MTTTPSAAIGLCSGSGQLEEAVRAVTGIETVAYAENNPHASAVMAARFPGLPNLGGIDAINYREVAERFPNLDTLIAGWPCQGISHNGHRLGLDDPRSGLWRSVAQAISFIRAGAGVPGERRRAQDPWPANSGGEPERVGLRPVLDDH
ncbi:MULTISPECIES: DNA cytosine methyltransferase [Streptomyces]|uniref:DNA cytosine methyltransferase n=1 Tax=Streptomyces sp. CC71 TaxID=1770211 RepID=UPI00078354A2|nr:MULTISPECIES: DNA cytosine methyltransferase [Streptomyces]KYK14234.1 hypothetical protein AUW26_28085 [Streptomyces sp. CC71]